MVNAYRLFGTAVIPTVRDLVKKADNHVNTALANLGQDKASVMIRKELEGALTVLNTLNRLTNNSHEVPTNHTPDTTTLTKGK